jgi:hypothetical protein
MQPLIRQGSYKCLFANRLGWANFENKGRNKIYYLQCPNQFHMSKEFHVTKFEFENQKTPIQRSNLHEPRFYDPQLMKAEQNELKYDYLTPQQIENTRDQFYHDVRDYYPYLEPLPREIGGPTGPEPTRYGDWERYGRVSDF